MRIVKSEIIKKERRKYVIVTFKTATDAYKHTLRLQKHNISCAIDGTKVASLIQV